MPVFQDFSKQKEIMENNENKSTSGFGGLFANPSVITDITKDPAKYAKSLYNSLSTRNKQYIIYAAGVGLLVYGYTLKKKK